mgnify:CR=1 FL=1
MTLEVGKIYTFKFNSGEEMIAKVHSEITGNYINVSDPLSVAPNNKGMGLIPSLFTSDPEQSVTINTNSIAMYAEAEDSIKMKYIEVTTGIQVPDKKIILG